MKLEENFIKELLKEIRENGDGITWQCEHVTSNSPDNEKKKAYHLKLLVSSGLLEGRVAKYDYLGGGGEMKVFYVDLTYEGHLVLDTMENDTILKKVKNGLFQVGKKATGEMAVDAVKIAPTLLIKAILLHWGLSA